MAVLIAVLVLVLIGLVVLVVSAPLRRAGASAGPAGEEERRSEARAGARRLRRDELEASREAKYREIRDAEMDFRTGKLSEEDYAVLDAELRTEALTVLDALQALDAAERDPEQD